jgi:hypothetical protein
MIKGADAAASQASIAGWLKKARMGSSRRINAILAALCRSRYPNAAPSIIIGARDNLTLFILP